MLVQLAGIDLMTQMETMRLAIEQYPISSRYPADMVAKNIVDGVTHGYMQAWVHVENVDNSQCVLGLYITMITADDTLGNKSLLLYYVINNGMSIESKKTALEDLRQFGRDNNCNQIAYYTNRQEDIDEVEELGGTVQSKLLTYEIERRV